MMENGLRKDGAIVLGKTVGVALPMATGLTLPQSPVSQGYAQIVSSIETENSQPQSVYRQFGKRLLDIALVLISLPLTLPIIVLCSMALALESGLPFYRQHRLGRNGAEFRLLKLRTMVRDADKLLERVLETDPELREEWETTQKLKKDPRITRVGAILRATSLDELPQIWNVLLGQMSLVGPRPMMPEQLPLYGDPRAYFALRPGITGLWQVSARNENRFDYRCQVDAAYEHDLSLGRDIMLMVRTISVVVRRTGY